MPRLADLITMLEAFAPLRLAESWDNVGLLVGDSEREIRRVMTCLTITPSSAREAIDERADAILTHHPLPFRPLKRLTTATVEGRLLIDLIAAGIAIYSPHTAFDSALAGINQQWAEGLGLTSARPLVAAPDTAAGEGATLGAGRHGELPAPATLGELAAAVKRFLRIDQAQIVGPGGAPVTRVGVACGSGGEFVAAALAAGCQALVTGEARFHTCLEAESQGLGLVLAGHYASERFAVETLAGIVAQRFAELEVWASRRETDPLRWV
jgi:dinuclear metal center YbgI/SA1388 family protein